MTDVETAFQQWALENTPEDAVLPDDAFDWFEAGWEARGND